MPSLLKSLIGKAVLLGNYYNQQGAQDIVLPSTNQRFLFFAGNGEVANPKLFSDAGTTPIADGGAVQQWTDETNTYSPSQATGTAKPTYHINGLGVNSRASVEFFGGDWLEASIASTILGSGNFTLYIAYATSSVSVVRDMYAEANSGAANPYIQALMNANTADRVQAQVRGDAGTPSYVQNLDAPNANDGDVHVYSLSRSGNTFTTRLDDLSASNTAAIGTMTINRLLIGAFLAGAQSFIGRIGCIAGYGAVYDAAIKNTIYDYYTVFF